MQVKATQGTGVALRAQPDHLVVILLKRDGTIEEIYNRQERAWTNCGKPQKNGQSPISVSKLRRLMNDVPHDEQLPRRK